MVYSWEEWNKVKVGSCFILHPKNGNTEKYEIIRKTGEKITCNVYVNGKMQSKKFTTTISEIYWDNQYGLGVELVL